jgi:hypothetical protein
LAEYKYAARKSVSAFALAFTGDVNFLLYEKKAVDDPHTIMAAVTLNLRSQTRITTLISAIKL